MRVVTLRGGDDNNVLFLRLIARTGDSLDGLMSMMRGCVPGSGRVDAATHTLGRGPVRDTIPHLPP